MLWLIGGIILVAAVFGPSLWVGRVLKKYSKPVDRYSGTGGKLARELLDRCGLQTVGVELTEAGDHYDPITKCVRLSKAHMDGCSLTAITVAAHEVGHATQDRDKYAPLRMRTAMVALAIPAQKMGAGMLMLAPLITLLTRTPIAGVFMLMGGFLSLGTGTLVHMITLPMEMNASFARALPMLEQGDYLIEGDAPYARKILKACAWTYAAASLMSLLNIGRWWAVLRR